MKYKLSVIIPCYNEENTLKECVDKLLTISDEAIELEIIIVNDASSDHSMVIADGLKKDYTEVTVITHKKNQGKGAALRTGFKNATGDFVAVQDADLEYEPKDLRRLIVPLIEGRADVVFGSRFLSNGEHRVIYFWHSVGNKILTLLSNMFTDINLTDMETCYKVFRREVIKKITIKEDRFGFEPEIVAKIAQMRLKIYEMGISYHGRTYSEGKKIGIKDGFRALYCIFRYNAHKAPIPIQFIIYVLIGGLSAIANIGIFLLLLNIGLKIDLSIPTAFIFAALINYTLCILLLFKHKAQWAPIKEIFFYFLVVFTVCLIDYSLTKFLISLHLSPGISKMYASIFGLFFNFIGRRYYVFKEQGTGPWL